MLLGFTTDHGGTVNGADRSQLAWVPQRPALLAGTIAANVALGTSGADDADIRLALHRAAADDLDPARVLGEDGAGLSAGERQRVALARAFCRAQVGGARWFLLDEPTSHLDRDTEARVVQSLRELVTQPGHERGALLVVHRPSLAAVADQVVRIGTIPAEELVPAGTA